MLTPLQTHNPAKLFLIAAMTIAAHAQPATVDPHYKPYVPTKPLHATIRIAKSEAMATLLGYWTKDFHALNPNVTFEFIPIKGNSPGAALTEGAADIGPLARELPPEERAAFHEKFGSDPLAIRVAGGSYKTPDKALAIAFLVNTANPINKLTFAQIDAIYSKRRLQGLPEAKTWGDLGATGDWKNTPIHIWGLVRPGEAAHVPVSGNISRFLSERIMLNGEFRDDISERTTVGAPVSAFEAIARGIATDPGAIGYGGFNNVIPGVKSVAIATTPRGPFYAGTFDEVATQRYPLSRVIYLYVNAAPGKPLAPAIREFLRFVLSRQGQQDVVRESIFLPLPYAMATEDLAKLP